VVPQLLAVHLTQSVVAERTPLRGCKPKRRVAVSVFCFGMISFHMSKRLMLVQRNDSHGSSILEGNGWWGGSGRVYCYIRRVPVRGLISTRMIGHASTTRSAEWEGQRQGKNIFFNFRPCFMCQPRV